MHREDKEISPPHKYHREYIVIRTMKRTSTEEVKTCNICGKSPYGTSAEPVEGRTQHFHSEDLVAYKCRAECFDDVLKSMKKLADTKIYIYDWSVGAIYSFEEQVTGDIEFTFAVERHITYCNLRKLMDECKHGHRMADTLMPKEKYTGDIQFDDEWRLEEEEEEEGEEEKDKQ